MSLINRMLQDLEQRNAPSDTAVPISGEVRAVSAASKNSLAVLVVLMFGLLVAGALVWTYLAQRKAVPVVSVAAVPPPVQMPPAQVTPAPVPSVQAVTSPAPEMTPAAVPVPPAEELAPTEIPARRLPGLDTRLSALPAASRSTLPVLEEKRELTVPAHSSSPVMQGADSEAAPQRSAPPAKQKPEAGVSMKSISAAQQSDNLYRQSVTLLQQGRVAEAQDALRKSLDANARNLKARQSLVGLMVESKHPDEAVSLLKEGLKLSPEQTVFSMALSRLQVEAGDSKGARDTLEQGLQYAGDDAEFHAFYAALLQRNEQHEEAVQHYLTALRADPAMPTWLIGVGISLQAQGNANDAIAAFQRARDTGQLTPQLKQFVEQRLRQLKPYR